MPFQKGHKFSPGGKKGFKHSEETKRKLSIARLGKKASKETKTKISNSLKGRVNTWGEKISVALKGIKRGSSWNKGKHFSQETRAKISNSLSGRFKGAKSPHWKGGKIKRFNYVVVYCPNHPFAVRKYVYEHRLVVEKYIKRYLKSIETVHHINHIENDNRPENLMAFVNHGVHNKFAKNKHINPSDIIFDGRKLIASV